MKKAVAAPAPLVDATPPKLPGADCANCPARKGRMLPSILAAGRPARLVVLGERPCESDLKEGAVFRSSGARLLQRGLATLGIRQHEVHWSNAVACACGPKDLPKARKCCAGRVARELAEVEAAGGSGVVLALGAEATQSALGLGRKTPIMKWRGAVCEATMHVAQYSETGEPSPKGCDMASHGPVSGVRTRLVLPIIHPAECRRTPKWMPVLETDIARLGRVLEEREAGGVWMPPEVREGRRLVIAQTLSTLQLELSRLGPEVVLDVETVGLGPTSTRLVCVGLSDGATTLVIPWSTASNGLVYWWPEEGAHVARMISAALASRVTVTHNGPNFDHIVCARYGISWGKWDDTLIASHSSEGHLPKNLAFVVTASGVDAPPWKQLEDRGADIERLWIYNGRDCLYTALAWRVRRARVTA